MSICFVTLALVFFLKKSFHSAYLTCVEQDNQETETEGATRQEDVTGSYQLMQQQLKQANETMATLLEQLGRLQQTTSRILTVLWSASLHCYLLSIYASALIQTLTELMRWMKQCWRVYIIGSSVMLTRAELQDQTRAHNINTWARYDCRRHQNYHQRCHCCLHYNLLMIL